LTLITHLREHRQDARVAIQILVGDLTARKKPHEGHIAQSAAQALQLGTGRAKMRPTAACATDVNGAQDFACRVRL
jgi:hypothetical protein